MTTSKAVWGVAMEKEGLCGEIRLATMKGCQAKTWGDPEDGGVISLGPSGQVDRDASRHRASRCWMGPEGWDAGQGKKSRVFFARVGGLLRGHQVLG